MARESDERRIRSTCSRVGDGSMCAVGAADACPMCQVADRYALLRTALVGIVGADSVDEVKAIADALRRMPVPAEDKTALLDAVHALLATMPPAPPVALPEPPLAHHQV